MFDRLTSVQTDLAQVIPEDLRSDTLGELGMFYSLAPFAFIGGSLVPHGGQNPLEAAKLGCPLLIGPHTDNFAEIAAALEQAEAARLLVVARPLHRLRQPLSEKAVQEEPQQREKRDQRSQLDHACSFI